MPTNEPPLEPESVVKQYYAALNSRKANDAIKLFAQDAVYLQVTTPDATMAIRRGDWIAMSIEAQLKEHIKAEPCDFQVMGDKIACLVKVSTDHWRQTGLAPIEEMADVIIQDGKIKSFTTTWTQETIHRIQAWYDKPVRLSKTVKRIAKTRQAASTKAPKKKQVKTDRRISKPKKRAQKTSR